MNLAPNESVALDEIGVEGAELLVQGFERLLRERGIRRLVVEVTDKFLRRFGGSSAELYDYLAVMASDLCVAPPRIGNR